MVGLPHKRSYISFYGALHRPLPHLSYSPFPLHFLGDGQAGKVPGVQACLQPGAPPWRSLGKWEACVCLLNVLECMGSVAHAYSECAEDMLLHGLSGPGGQPS